MIAKRASLEVRSLPFSTIRTRPSRSAAATADDIRSNAPRIDIVIRGQRLPIVTPDRYSLRVSPRSRTSIYVQRLADSRHTLAAGTIARRTRICDEFIGALVTPSVCSEDDLLFPVMRGDPAAYRFRLSVPANETEPEPMPAVAEEMIESLRESVDLQAPRPFTEIKPPMIFEELRHGVLGQNRALRFVSVAIYKHTTGKVPGNLLMIGNSGTGKTTVMNNIQRLYNEVPEYQPFRAVTIINANLLVDVERMEFQPERLLRAVEQRARALCGTEPSPAALKEAIERATICIDEIDKMSAVVAGKPNPIGVVLQQGLLTLMEGEKLVYPLHAWQDGREKKIDLEIDTSHMMFICGGAFEGLYDQVYNRVLKPGSGEKLKTQTIRTAEGKVKMETFFALGNYLKPKDLFEFGMVPQFMARFENTVLLNDLSIDVLKEILLKSYDSPFVRSRRFFEVLEIDLRIEDLAAALLAEHAHKDTRTGARALRPIFADIINPLEFDPSRGNHLQPGESGRQALTVTADMVRKII